MDTWSILEARFHGIGDRDHNVVLNYHIKDAEHCGYSASGPVVEGEHCIRLTGAPRDGSIPQPDFTTGHYSVDEFWGMLYRAGRLLNQEQHRGVYDIDGAERFVAALVYHFGNSLSHESNGQTFFSNGARACGMMAGKLAALEISVSDPEDKTKEKPPLFGMTIDSDAKTVKRFIAVNIDNASCVTINNDDQWALFQLVRENGGTVVAAEVHRLLPLRSERGNTIRRLNEKLGELQLELKHKAGVGYVLQEFSE